jgi:hypothetical protein
MLFLFLSVQPVLAHEGMWLPHLLKQIEGTMQQMGMRMSAEDIFTVNGSSIKDAVLHFGGGCTGSVISSQGLVLTNHHCGYGQIQSHSSVERNLLRDGFWAADQSWELPNPGLTVTFIRRIEDVTAIALEGVGLEMSEAERQSRIDRNLKAYTPSIQKEADEDHFFRPIYFGNQYLLFITLTYRDVRLVGTPPESIGKFGADTDNWIWPRHTGDFALFRVYAGPDNRPADYHPDNRPYQPVHFLPVSMDGVEEGDFTLVFGFPGRTQQYLPASAVAMNLRDINPPRIAIRDTALQILDRAMRADEATRIQYASKYARIANAWKKWIGENQGLEQTGALQKKQAAEREFRGRVAGDPQYNTLLDELDRLVAEITPLEVAAQYHNEIVLRTIEIFTPARLLGNLLQRLEENGEAGYQDYLARIKPSLAGFYKDYRPDLDQQVFVALMRMYSGQGDPEMAHEAIFRQFTAPKVEASSKRLFANTALQTGDGVLALLDRPSSEVKEILIKDPVFHLYRTLQDYYVEKVARPLALLQDALDAGMRRYMAARMAYFPEQAFYPDANSTLRVTFGQVEGYQPEGMPRYASQTWLSGVVEKYVPGDYEFDVPTRLLELEKQRDFGPYGTPQGMPVCFIGSNHTTGGNSGSPSLDAHGNLIGLNFDRVWEGTMSDLNFDPSICRNIMVDARYILFITDKFAGASHLVEEMTLVHPKRD